MKLKTIKPPRPDNRIRIAYVPKWDWTRREPWGKTTNEEWVEGKAFDNIKETLKWIRPRDRSKKPINIYAQLQYCNYHKNPSGVEKFNSWLVLFEEKVVYDRKTKIALPISNDLQNLYTMLRYRKLVKEQSALETLRANFKLKLDPDGLVVYLAEEYITLRLNKKETENMGIKEFPTRTPNPEIVHLEISNRCDKHCEYCYVHEKGGKELSTDDWEIVIRKLAAFGVFQITFGGGEPFMRDDIIGLAEFTKRLKLNVCVTSNGYFMQKPNITVEDLKVFDQVNVSYHGNKEEFEKAYKYLSDNQIRRGVNFVLSTDYQDELLWVASTVKKYGGELLLLTYKPTLKDIQKQIPPEKVLAIAKLISAKFEMPVGVDGLTCGTCMATKRFVDVDSEGNMTPCSFIRTPIGNLIEEHIRTIWDRRPDDIKCPYLVKENKNGKLCKVCNK